MTKGTDTMRSITLALGVICLVMVVGCSKSHMAVQPLTEEPAVIFFNITSSASDNPHPVTMALQLAGHTLDDGRTAVLFFNVRGAGVPTNKLPDDLAFHAKPIKTMLKELADRGAEIHVCPHCMKALGITESDLIEGALVTDRERLFSHLGTNTVVFTY